MDLNKLGAIGSLIGGIIGAVSFGATIWPYPQFKAWRAKTGQGGAGIATPKLIALPVAISLILSCVSMYAAWHSGDCMRVSHSEPPLIEVRGRDFVDEEIPLDLHYYTHCSFHNVRFKFNGTSRHSIVDSKFTGSVGLDTDNDVVMITFETMKELCMTKPNVPLTFGPDYLPAQVGSMCNNQ
jgi:hypothetical protein